MFRTADGAGVKKIYLTGYTPSPYDFFGKLRPDFAKTALNAEKYVAWEQQKNVASLLAELKRKTPPSFGDLPLVRGGNNYFPSFTRRGLGRCFILSLEQSPRAISYDRFVSKHCNKLKRCDGVALIVGNEVRGLSQAILKKSDAIIEIPMHGKKESLNVAVAAGIALFALRDIGRR